MISRVFRGRSVSGVLRGLYAEDGCSVGVGVHLVGSWDGDPAALEPPPDAAGRVQTAALTRCLSMPVRACDRAPKQWVYHLALRTAPEDRRLSDEEWAAVCTAAMDRTGIAPHGDPAGCRWVAVRSGPDHDGDQVHVLATLAREDGREPHVWRDYWRLRDVAREYEQRLGLRATGAGWRSQ